MIAPAVKMATALDPYVVRVVFADGEVRDVDIEPLLGGPIFEELREPRSFAQVEVDEYGETIVWPNGADLDPDVLYGLAEPPSGAGATRQHSRIALDAISTALSFQAGRGSSPRAAARPRGRSTNQSRAAKATSTRTARSGGPFEVGVDPVSLTS